MSPPRPIWKGAITFGLVSVPVVLYSATRREAEVPFRLLHRPDLAPIDYKRFCSKEDVEVEWRDIVKGYEYARGRFVVVTEQDFKRVRIAATHTIEIRDFVRAADIDVGHFESPYWLVPTREGRKPYVLLRMALAKSGRVGIGTIVIRQRERLAAVRPADSALMLATMRLADELRSAEGLGIPDSTPLDKREIELALRLIDSLAAEWKPERYKDTFRESLRAAIERKIEGKEIAVAEAPRAGKVVDLMDALQASLKAGPRKRAAVGRRPARRRPKAA